MKQSRYLSYLLRLWESPNGERSTWRASLEDPQTRERLGFARPAELFAFLEAQMEPIVEGQSAAGTEIEDESGGET
jgi:hypothetical protein